MRSLIQGQVSSFRDAVKNVGTSAAPGRGAAEMSLAAPGSSAVAPARSGQGRGGGQPGCSVHRRPAVMLRAEARGGPPCCSTKGRGGRPWCFGQGRMAAGPAARKCAVLLCIDKL